MPDAIHPFFKASRPPPSSPPSTRKKRKPNPTESASLKRQGTLYLDGPLISLVKPPAPGSSSGTPPPVDPAPKMLETPLSLDNVDADGDEDAEGEVDDEYMSLYKQEASPPVEAMKEVDIREAASSPASVSEAAKSDAPLKENDRPAKMLKFNMKTGTLGSPPKKNKSLPKSEEPPKRGRPKKKMVVTIKYGKDDASRQQIGQRIIEILAKEPNPTLIAIAAPPAPAQMIVSAPKQVSAPVMITGTLASSKSTHPFFKKVASTAATPTPSSAKKNTISMSTPCSPKKRPVKITGIQGLTFSVKNSGLKVPGAAHPLFPPRDMVHIRGEITKFTALRSQFGFRKSKRSAVNVSDEESVVRTVQERIDFDRVRGALERLSEDFVPVEKGMRIPTRHVESGRCVQQRIRPQLRTPLAPAASAGSDSDSEDELAVRRRVPKWKKEVPHPFVERLWRELPGTLSAYDRCTCECLPWTTKYAPKTAGEVLQSGKEAVLLKEWLLTLKVDAVHTGSSGPKKPKEKKKRRKKGALDGFIAEDEEGDEVYESEEDENAVEWTADRYGDRRSVVRQGGKVGNAVVISGCKGVGKTAGVYAVAGELGFEVFEINAGARRAGKDVLEKVGDMTRNHLVQREGSKSGTPAKGGLAGFFGKKTVVKKDKESKKEKERGEKEPAAQKQSLILIEEADVLYDEDRAFWATLGTLMATAKRPFVFVCNDETAVPLATLPLHGIFRLRNPPVAEAVDSLLLMAAAEGHILRREVVEAVVKERGGDLRGAITQLQFWCQIGVGDQRGGFGWVLGRWPVGRDLDARGDKVRVVSEGGVEVGMGWRWTGMEEKGKRAWEDFGVDVFGWGGWEAPARRELPTLSNSEVERLRKLEEFQNAAETMSVADVVSMGAFAKDNQVAIDPTQPDIPVKRREDAILGAILLDAEAAETFDGMAMGVAVMLKAGVYPVVFRATDATEDIDFVAKRVIQSFDNPEPRGISRPMFSLAFDPIAVSTAFVWAAHIDPSVFDRSLRLIVEDVAPYVRGIIFTEKQRRALTKGSEDSRGKRRGRRQREWFGVDIVEWAVMATGGEKWGETAWGVYRGMVEEWVQWWEEKGRQQEEEQRKREDEMKMREIEESEKQRQIMLLQQQQQQRQQMQMVQHQVHQSHHQPYHLPPPFPALASPSLNPSVAPAQLSSAHHLGSYHYIPQQIPQQSTGLEATFQGSVGWDQQQQQQQQQGLYPPRHMQYPDFPQAVTVGTHMGLQMAPAGIPVTIPVQPVTVGGGGSRYVDGGYPVFSRPTEGHSQVEGVIVNPGLYDVEMGGNEN